MSWIEVVRSKLTTEQVIERYLGAPNRLKKFLCPFHNDKSPSLSINPRTGKYRCFSCGAHGDMIDFVQDYFNVTKKEALEILDRDFYLGLKDIQNDSEVVREAIHKREQEKRLQEELKARVEKQISIIRLARKVTRDGYERLLPKEGEMEVFTQDDKRVNACFWFFFQNAWAIWLEDCLTLWEYNGYHDENPFHFELSALGENPMMFTVGNPKENFLKRRMSVLEKLEKGEFEPICNNRNIMT